MTARSGLALSGLVLGAVCDPELEPSGSGLHLLVDGSGSTSAPCASPVAVGSAWEPTLSLALILHDVQILSPISTSPIRTGYFC